MIDYNKILFAALICSVIQITIYFFIKFLSNKGVISNYFAKQKIHEGEVPRVGGLLFISSFLITLIIVETNYILLNLPLVFGSFNLYIFFLRGSKQSLSPYFRLIILFIGSLYLYFFLNTRYKYFITSIDQKQRNN